MNWMDTFKSIAPALEAGLSMTGPVGLAASAALAGVLGTPNAPDAVKAALATATPEQYAAIKKLDNDFQIQWKQLGVELLQAEVADAKDARATMTANKSFWPTFSLGAAITLLTLGLEGYLLLHGIPPETDKYIVGRVLGTLDALALGFWGYLYGSSKGSQDKDVMLYNSTPAAK